MQRKIQLEHVNPFLTCAVCKGYLVDATTIVECLHSFCRGCIIRHLENSYNCPKCSTEIHKTKPFEYIRSDPSLQEIVYKLVPELYQNEETRKEHWKKQEKKDSTKEEGNNRKDDEEENPRILVTLKYFRGTSRMERIKTERVLQMFPTRYLCCQPEMPVRVLKKFVQYKFDISTELFKLEMWRGDETLLDELTLKQLVQIYGLYRERKPLELHYSLLPKFESKTTEESKIKPAIPRPHLPSSPAFQRTPNDVIEGDKEIEKQEEDDGKFEEKHPTDSTKTNIDTESTINEQIGETNNDEESSGLPENPVENPPSVDSNLIKQEDMDVDGSGEQALITSSSTKEQSENPDSVTMPDSQEQKPSIFKNNKTESMDEKLESRESPTDQQVKDETETCAVTGADSSETNTSYESCLDTLSSLPDTFDTPMETED
ncbi:polycomb complex protein BMI-1-B-like [Clytia hemisphaerica]|uniref:RING-type domain-containing protein n=1 Tax=Clytia hemisphaerica TaxID=252671 RepID=A0A7M5WVR3_9CNID